MSRTTPDFSYDADPSTAYWVYASSYGGMLGVYGTSAGAPQWAALIALVDQGLATNNVGSLDGSTQTIPALYNLAREGFLPPGFTVLGVARLLEDLGQGSAAGELYREYMNEPGKPEQGLDYARYLARSDRMSEALDILERAWNICPPNVVATACLGALHDARPQDKQCRRVEDWLRRAMSRAPKSAHLLVCMADLQNMRGRYEDAKTLYRQVLERNGKDPIALNNLAWLLVFHDRRAAEAQQELSA